MKDPRCWREVLIRGGITLIIVGIAIVFLDADPWALLAPLAIAALVVLKWALRAPEDDEDARDGSGGPGVVR